ncbi:O-antigen ligase family protein [Mucilaginibacter lutimaris]|uniref:O-antigen ligase family protein n=1 Tax=Mucilaginibacter lutimaris TaxID=931629 RepID=A0ABW2ZAR0_9SPHI
MTKNSVFKHPGVKAFFLYFIASQINDPLSVSFGGIPVTPIQIAIIAGIIMTIKYWSSFVYNKLALFYGFLLLIVLYTFVKLLNEGEIALYCLTLMFNLVWVTCVSSALIKIKIKKDDYTLVLKRLMLCLIPSIIFGSYEFITRKYLFPEGLGGAMKVGLDDNNFYIRGGFRDKFDFSSFILFGPVIFLSFYLNKIRLSLLYKGIALLCTFLLLFSYSTSVILSFGVILVYALLFMGNIKRSVPLIGAIVVLALASVTYITQSDIYKNQINAYNLKYQRQVEDKDESSFRWNAIKVGLEHFTDKPIFGFGLDNGKNVIFKYAPTISNKPTNSHNYFINNLLDFGLLGFGVLSAALVNIFFFYRKTKKWRSLYKPLSDFLTMLFIFNIITFQSYYHSFDRSMYFVLIFFVFFYFSQKLNDESTNMRSENFGGRSGDVGVEVSSGA